METETPATERRLPTLHVLQSAYRVSRLLSVSPEPIERVRESYQRVPSDGLFDGDALYRGEEVLTRAGLTREDGRQISAVPELAQLRDLEERDACRVLLSLLLEAERPLWLRVAIGRTGVQEAYVPEDVLRRLQEVFPDSEDREAFLMGFGRVDPDAKAELGLAGEEFIVGECREQRRKAGHPDLVAGVQRVSRFSDHLGYDVSAPCPSGPSYHLEVKTVGRPGNRLTVHLSRNQVEVGIRDPRWRLVICRRGASGFEVVGWCRARTLEALLPRDGNPSPGVQVRWESIQVILDEAQLSPGLPPVDQC